MRDLPDSVTVATYPSEWGSDRRTQKECDRLVNQHNHICIVLSHVTWEEQTYTLMIA